MSNFIRVLRNRTLYADRAAAKTKLEEQLAKLQDGEICIASYGATWDAAKTILGVVRFKTVDGVAKRSYTIFDNEANSAEILAKIQELDATVKGNLTAGDAVETGKHVGVKVVEVDGKLTDVTVVESDIASAKLLGNLRDASSVESAFGRIAKEVEDRGTAITNAIAALDGTVAATAESNNQLSVLTGVTQTDGKLAGKTEVKLAAVAKTGSASDVATTAIAGNTEHVAVAGTTVSAQITDIAKTLKGITTTQANALKYRTVKLSDAEVTALKDSNVKEAYKVVSYTGTWTEGTSTGTQVGDIIKIYKDATIKEIYLGNTGDTINETTGDIIPQTTPKPSEKTSSLNYAYIKADGKYAMASIPVGNFLRESEFKNGLDVNKNGEVSVKVDSTSENFLSVGQNGVKVSGVQTAIDTAIDTAIQGLDANVTSDNNNNVTVNVVETDGKVSAVNVSTTGLALDNDVVKAVTVNGVNATVTSNKADVTIKGGNIAVADNYTATVYPAPFETKVGTANHIAANDKISEALKKTENTISVLANEVITNEKVTTAAVSKLAESAGVLGADGVIKYTPKDNANYIGGATSVHDATVKLDAAIKNLGDGALTSVAGGNGIEVSTKASNSQTVSLKLNAAADNALTVDTNGLYLSNVWDCGEY